MELNSQAPGGPPPIALVLIHEAMDSARLAEALAAERGAAFLCLGPELLCLGPELPGGGSRFKVPHLQPVDALLPAATQGRRPRLAVSDHWPPAFPASQGMERELQDAAFAHAMREPRAVLLLDYLDQQPMGKDARDLRIQLMGDLCLNLKACASQPKQSTVVLVATSRPETLGPELLQLLQHRFLVALPTVREPPCRTQRCPGAGLRGWPDCERCASSVRAAGGAGGRHFPRAGRAGGRHGSGCP